MWAVLLLGTIGVAAGALVTQPAGFTIQQYDAAFGNFQSHEGYPTKRYANNIKGRAVITTDDGSQAEVSIDTADNSTFCIRSYDFAVIYDCEDSAKITQPCVVAGYQVLGSKESGAYTSITMANRAGIRTFRSKSNSACLDFCVHPFDSTTADPKACMLGFQAYWVTIPGPTTTPVPTTTPLPPTLPPFAPDFVGKPIKPKKP